MPQALAFIAPTIFGAGGSAALFGVAGGLTGLGIATSIGGSLLLSAASNALLSKSSPSTTPDNIKLNIKQSIGDRVRHYGRVRVGGTITFFRARGGKFYRVIAHGQGFVDEIEAFILDSREVAVASNYVTDPQYINDGVNLVYISSRRGSTTSAHYAEIAAIWPDFDSTHQLKGICTTLTIAESVSAEEYRAIYPRNEPSLEVILRGVQVWDPRTSTTIWSDNPALIIADFITHPDGLNKPGAVDMTTVSTAANHYDEMFALAGGGTEKRARLWGSYSLTEQPSQVLRRMQAACGADVRLMPSGKIGIYSSKWVAPDVTITRDQVIAIDEWEGGPEQVDRYTELPFVYTDPALGFQSITGDPWIDEVREAANGQAAIGSEADYSFCPSHAQARYMAQRQIEIDNPAYTLKIRLKPSGRLALFERFVQIDMPELPSVFWRVLGYTLDLSNGGVTLNLASYVPTYRSSANDGVPQVLPAADTAAAVPTPTGASAAGGGVKSAQNSYSAGIVAIWDTRPSVALSPILEYKVSGAADWQVWPLTDKSKKANIAALVDGGSYDLRLFYQTSDDKKSAYVNFTGVIASASTAAPDAATSFTVTDMGGGEARVKFRASASDNLWRSRVLRDGTAVATIYGDQDNMVTVIDSPGAGTYDYKIRSVNVSGITGADVGPITITIT